MLIDPVTPERFWLVHSFNKLRRLQDALEQVSEFLKNSRDVIIWDSHSFRRVWEKEDHQDYRFRTISIFSHTLQPVQNLFTGTFCNTFSGVGGSTRRAKTPGK